MIRPRLEFKESMMKYYFRFWNLIHRKVRKLNTKQVIIDQTMKSYLALGIHCTRLKRDGYKIFRINREPVKEEHAKMSRQQQLGFRNSLYSCLKIDGYGIFKINVTCHI